MSYLAFAAFAAVCFSTTTIINKLTSKHTLDNKDSLLAYLLLSSFTFALVLYPFVDRSIPPTQTLLTIFASSITFFSGMYLLYTGIFTTDVSVYAPLFQIQSGLVAILAYIFLHEQFPASNYLWISLIISGAILTSIDEKLSIKTFFTKGIFMIIGMQVFHAIANILVGLSLQTVNFLQFLFWEYLFAGILFIIVTLITKPKLNYPLKNIAPMFLVGSINGTGALSLFRAYQENLTISNTIGMLDTPIVFLTSILASRFYPKLLEHHTPKVYAIRSIGLIIILISAYHISTS